MTVGMSLIISPRCSFARNFDVDKSLEMISNLPDIVARLVANSPVEPGDMAEFTSPVIHLIWSYEYRYSLGAG